MRMKCRKKGLINARQAIDGEFFNGHILRDEFIIDGKKVLPKEEFFLDWELVQDGPMGANGEKTYQGAFQFATVDETGYIIRQGSVLAKLSENQFFDEYEPI